MLPDKIGWRDQLAREIDCDQVVRLQETLVEATGRDENCPFVEPCTQVTITSGCQTLGLHPATGFADRFPKYSFAGVSGVGGHI